MRIGIDARLIHWPGIGRYIATLIKYLPQTGTQHEYIIYHASPQEYIPDPLPRQIIQKTFPHPPFSIAEQRHWPRQIRQDHLDVFHAPHYAIPLFTTTPVIVTIHDLVGFRYPEYIYSPFARLYYKLMTHTAVRKAQACITGSHFTRQEITALLKTNPQKVHTVHYGVDTERFIPNHPRQQQIQQKYNITTPSLLYLGTKKQWKNLPMLLNALSHIIQNGESVSLILAGKDAKHQQDISSIIQQLHLQNHVLEAGSIDEADMSALYGAATLFVFPSYYEGFGLPVLEAMASGVPVIASNAASIPELVGDAGVLLDPHNPDEWATAITQLLHDKPTRLALIQRGLARVQQFSWQDCSQNTLQVYQDAAHN